MPSPSPIDAARDLEALWRLRGGVKAAYRSLLGYAYECICRRSTATAGGQKVAQLKAEEVVNSAIEKALTSQDCPTQGEELYRLVRRNIDNPLRTLEKSPKAMRTVAVGDNVSEGEVAVIDEGTESPAEAALLDDEEAFFGRVVEETRRRLKSPNCLEARLLDLVLDRAGDKPKLCRLLAVDDAKFDRLKFTLKTVAGGALQDLKRKESR